MSVKQFLAANENGSIFERANNFLDNTNQIIDNSRDVVENYQQTKNNLDSLLKNKENLQKVGGSELDLYMIQKSNERSNNLIEQAKKEVINKTNKFNMETVKLYLGKPITWVCVICVGVAIFFWKKCKRRR